MWTMERPTRKGYWYFKEMIGVNKFTKPYIVDVYVDDNTLCAAFINGRREYVSSLGGEWQPVQGPRE